MHEITTTDAPTPSGAFAQGIDLGRFLYTAGQVGVDPDTGSAPEEFSQEVQQAIDNLKAILKSAGLDLESVVKTTCFLSDIANLAEFDVIYRANFGASLPARSAVGVQLPASLRFEIEAVAVRVDEDEVHGT